jgi:hypothetical protein
MKNFLIVCLLACLGTGALAQESPAVQRIPDEVFYLMPEFGEGMVFFRGQGPAAGRLNICAVDNTLRYIDDEGKEMSATSHDNILKVQIGDVSFLRYGDTFYRMYPINADTGIAVKRDVKIIKGARNAAYGTQSQTASIKEYGVIHTDGGSVKLDSNKEYPYTMSETLYLYKGDNILLVNKKNLQAFFPEKKAEIKSFFKSGHSLPQTPDELLSTLSPWL